MNCSLFLAPSELYKCRCLSVRPSVSFLNFSAYEANRAMQHDAYEDDDDEEDDDYEEDDDDEEDDDEEDDEEDDILQKNIFSIFFKFFIF